jgi:hypothetical protein
VAACPVTLNSEKATCHIRKPTGSVQALSKGTKAPREISEYILFEIANN